MHFSDQQQRSFLPSTFNDFEMDSKAENPILFDEMQNRENSPPPNTPVSEGRTRPLFETISKNYPDHV